jgi:hypothetical protein
MPVDRTLAEDLAATLVQLYAAAETRLAGQIGILLRADISKPDWADRKLLQLGALRRFAEQLVAKLAGDSLGTIDQLVTAAYTRGGEAALEELARLGGARAGELAAVRSELPGSAAVQRLVWSLVTRTRGTHVRIVRETADIYRGVVARTVATGTLQGTDTRVRTAQRALDDLLGKGISGFTDRAGRDWELASYVEMAVRTTTAQAAVQGHLDRLGDRGLDLVIVSNAPQECARCRPWEGKVLARNGPGGRRTVEVEHATIDGRMVRVDVAGSVDEAVGDGLMHPNCRHSLSAYLAGVTKPITHTRDEQGDKDRQKLRALERDVRAAKRREEAAIDPDAKAKAAADVRAGQAAIRAHVESTSAKRQPQRELIGVAR